MIDLDKLGKPAKMVKGPLREWKMLEYDPSGKDYSKIKIVKAHDMEEAIKKAQKGVGRLITKEELEEIEQND